MKNNIYLWIFAFAFAFALTTNTARAAPKRAKVSAKTRYNTKIRNLVYDTLKGRSKTDKKLRVALKGIEATDVRFKSRPASYRMNGMARALIGTGLRVREVKFSLAKGKKTKVVGRSELVTTPDLKYIVTSNMDGPVSIFFYDVNPRHSR